MTFYREPNGDYMVIYEENGYTIREGFPYWDARASAIGGLPSSVQGTGAGDGYLFQCERVCREDVPPDWLRYLE